MKTLRCGSRGNAAKDWQLFLLGQGFSVGRGASYHASFEESEAASQYLRSSTFDPQYNQIYLIRAALGVLAGFILGNFAHDLGLFSNGTAQVMGATLALIGGFSSEAVARVLQRVSDTLVTIVRGSGKDRAEAEMQAQLSKQLSKVSSELQDALTSDDEDQLQGRIRQVLRELNTRGR